MTLFQSIGFRSNQTMKLRKRKTVDRLTTLLFRLDQRVVETFDEFHFLVRIHANKRYRWNAVRLFDLHTRPGGRNWITTFFTSLHQTSPEIAKGCIACRE